MFRFSVLKPAMGQTLLRPTLQIDRWSLTEVSYKFMQLAMRLFPPPLPLESCAASPEANEFLGWNTMRRETRESPHMEWSAVGSEGRPEWIKSRVNVCCCHGHHHVEGPDI